MTRWVPATITVAGLVAAVGAYALFGLVFAGMIALATLCYAAFGKPIVGASVIPAGASVEPAEVRRYRSEHPGTSISAAAVAVTANQ